MCSEENWGYNSIVIYILVTLLDFYIQDLNCQVPILFRACPKFRPNLWLCPDKIARNASDSATFEGLHDPPRTLFPRIFDSFPPPKKVIHDPSCILTVYCSHFPRFRSFPTFSRLILLIARPILLNSDEWEFPITKRESEHKEHFFLSISDLRVVWKANPPISRRPIQ